LTLALAQELKQMHTQYPDGIFPPRICRVQQVLTVKAGRVPPGEIVSCWIPYPTVFQTQGNITYISASPDPLWIDHATSPIRSVFFRSTMPANGVLEFKVAYEYGASAYYREIDLDKVEPFTGDEFVYMQYTKEDPPHKIFSPELRALTDQIIRGETNPYLKAYRIYNWIADSIKYSYAREYSTLRNISNYCYTNRYGDCGQEAILFITLCRIAGIPARWQSGFFTFPNDEGMHDWSEIFIKPYGWLPVDTYMGIYFTSITQDLTADERKAMRRFYFGNIDHFRLVANKGHNQKLYPPKRHFRSETVDFQRGEVEWSGGNLYFPDWRWSLTVTATE
jgi:transglutaminase-like putative cysteine protease